MSSDMDGRFYADGNRVFRAPKETKRDDGTSSIALGFAVCEVSEYVTGDAPQLIAHLLNEALDRGDFNG